MDKDKQYQALYAEALKAYPQSSKKEVQVKSVELWKAIRSGDKSYDETVASLQTAAHKSKTKLSGWWMNLKPSSSKAATSS